MHKKREALPLSGFAVVLALLVALPCVLRVAFPVSAASLLASPSGLSVSRPLLVEGVDVGSTLVALQSQLQSQQSRLDEQQSRLDAQQQQIDELAKRNSSATALLQEFEQRIGQLQQTVTTLQSVVDSQHTQITALQANGTAAQQHQQDASGSLAALLTAQQSTLERQQSTLDRLVERNSTVRSELQALSDQVAPLQSADAALAQQLQRLNESLSESLTQHGEQLTALDGEVSAQQTQIDELAARNASTTALLQRYSQRFEQLQQTVSAVQTVIEQQHTLIEQLQQNGTADSGSLSTVLLQQQSTLAQQQSTLDRLVERNSSIERRLNSVEEQVQLLLQGDKEIENMLRQVNQSLSHELEQQDGQIALIHTKLDGLQQSDLALGQALDQQSNNLALINASLSQSFAYQGGQLGQLSLSLTQHAGQLSQINQSFVQSFMQQGNQLGQLSLSLTQQSGELTLLGQSLAQQGGQLSQLNATFVQSLSQQSTALGQLGGQVTQLDQSLTQQGDQLSQFSDQVAQIEQSFILQRDQINLLNQSLSQSLGQQSGQLAQLGGQVAQVGQSVAQQSNQLDQLSQSVTQQGGQVGALQQSLNQSLTQQSVQFGQMTTNLDVLLTHSVTSSVSECFALAAVAGAGGAVTTPSPASSGGCPAGFYTTGTSVTVAALPSSGFEFAQWSGASSSMNSAVTITLVGSAVSLLARFRSESTPASLPDQVLGQPDFYAQACRSGVGKLGLCNPNGLAVAPNGDLYVADTGSYRVLIFAPGATEPYGVIGQANFLGYGQNRGRSYPSAYSFNNPQGVAIDADGGLLVADTYNNRVLYFSPGATSTTPASRVYGQSDFVNTYTSPITASSLKQPADVAVGDGGVFIADYGNYRVLFYPNTSTTATRVIGQASLTVGTSFATTSSAFGQIKGIEVDAFGGLFVVDMFRVLYFPPGANVATRVFGQTDFTATAWTSGPTGLRYPSGVALRGNYLYVADSSNHRVMRFPANVSSPLADRMWGQPTIWSSDTSVEPGGMNYPVAVAFDAQGRMFVAEATNSRIQRFSPQP